MKSSIKGTGWEISGNIFELSQERDEIPMCKIRVHAVIDLKKGKRKWNKLGSGRHSCISGRRGENELCIAYKRTNWWIAGTQACQEKILSEPPALCFLTGEPTRDEKGDVLYSMGGSNEETLVINGFTGATEIMLTNVRAVSCIQAPGRTGAEFKGVFRCWRTKWNNIQLEEVQNRN